MAEHKFSYKEVIGHGWAMTKKYWSSILLIAVIYIGINLLSGVVQYFAGSGPIHRNEIREVYKDSIQADKFYQYLEDTGYIDRSGNVKDKLQNVKGEGDLELSSDFESQRGRIYDFLNKYRYRLPFPRVIFYVFTVGMWVVSMLMGIGFLKAYLKIARDEEPEIAELFSNWRILIPYLLGALCYGLVIMGGFILLIIPGLIFMLMFQFCFYLIIDKGLGPIKALKRSREITKGSKGRLAVLGMLLMLLNIGGLLCLVIGLFFTISISSIAMACVYDRLEKTFIV
ncbi:MAG: hypothetical protein HQL15_04225 [Candidatus Omnitrophica bacterium]|nr:hypothetical protein [Candidatus Omnitrophota bacterium]